MKKAIILMTMLFSSTVFAQSYTVMDITAPEASYVQLNGGGINFGISGGRINYVTSLGFPSAKTILESSAYSMDCTFNGYKTNCTNLVSIDNQTLPFVNEDVVGSINGAIQTSSYLGAKAVSTPTVGNPYKVTESSDGRLHYITLDVNGDGTNEFTCATNPQALDNQVLQVMGFYDKQLHAGYVYSISWIHRDTGAGVLQRYCYAPSMTIQSSNFSAPLPTPSPAPVSCPVGCVAQ